MLLICNKGLKVNSNDIMNNFYMYQYKDIVAKQFEASTISNISVNNLTYHITNRPINHKYAKLNMI